MVLILCSLLEVQKQQLDMKFGVLRTQQLEQTTWLLHSMLQQTLLGWQFLTIMLNSSSSQKNQEHQVGSHQQRQTLL
jgi:hypothetical protein